ncbi:hypothetical protein J2T19_005492 [Paenibacillus tundrae]|uniref:Uncharacterized protein n=1 Tax=Paenibacillus tundrae TaxID=528187 RepID=A0ABT9WLW2_9BACL|nr:hypothetical protein [Paenibacillus tundrae]
MCNSSIRSTHFCTYINRHKMPFLISKTISVKMNQAIYSAQGMENNQKRDIGIHPMSLI